MTLEFRPPPMPQPTEPTGYERAQQFGQLLGNLGNTAQGFAEQKKKDAMQQLLLQMKTNQEGRDQREADYKYGSPIDPNLMTGSGTGQTARSMFMPGGQGKVGTGMPLVEQFHQWRAGGMKKEGAQPEFMPALGEEERKKYYETANPKSAAGGVTPDMKEQDSLEKFYIQERNKNLSNRSGGLGLQDAKVNQAAHLRSLANQYYNQQTGGYDIPEAQAGELVMGLANLVSGANAATVEQLRSITPKNFQADTAHLVSYWTGKPITYQPQEMTKNLLDSIDRQGQVSQEMRDRYQSQLDESYPSGLSPERVSRIRKTSRGTDFNTYLHPKGQAMEQAPVLVHSEAEALSLPAGTRFSFNGRTGTVH